MAWHLLRRRESVAWLMLLFLMTMVDVTLSSYDVWWIWGMISLVLVQTGAADGHRGRCRRPVHRQDRGDSEGPSHVLALISS